eukprot:COSAG02_NODE_14253_length_1293_cov_0.876047_2_plen_96_part_01
MAAPEDQAAAAAGQAQPYQRRTAPQSCGRDSPSSSCGSHLSDFARHFHGQFFLQLPLPTRALTNAALSASKHDVDYPLTALFADESADSSGTDEAI